MTQNSSKEFFGLGQFDQADSIHIEWPSGHLDVLYDVSGNQTLVIQEGNSISGNILYQGLHICDGDSILLVAEDGLNPVWNGSIETDSLWVSEVGNYSYMATTEYGIPFTSEFVTVNLETLAASITEITDPSCAGEENGSISVEVDDDATIYIDDLLYTEPLDNLPAGEYTVTVTQAGFCSSIESVTLVDPDTLSLEIIVTHPQCYDDYGSAEVEVSGGTEPYEISWGIIDPMELEEGIHSCEIIDGNDCLAQANCEIIAPEEIDTDIITTPADEGDNGVIVLEIEGGQEPYVVNWNGPNGYSGSGEMIEDLEPGIYTATIVDNNGCLEILIIDLDGMNTVEFALSNIAISPNPFQDVIIVSNLTGNETEIAVISHQGQLVKQFPVSNNDSAIKLDLSSVAKGLYILQIKANNQLISYKIIHS